MPNNSFYYNLETAIAQTGTEEQQAKTKQAYEVWLVACGQAKPSDVKGAWFNVQTGGDWIYFSLETPGQYYIVGVIRGPLGSLVLSFYPSELSDQPMEMQYSFYPVKTGPKIKPLVWAPTDDIAGLVARPLGLFELYIKLEQGAYSMFTVDYKTALRTYIGAPVKDIKTAKMVCQGWWTNKIGSQYEQ